MSVKHLAAGELTGTVALQLVIWLPWETSVLVG